ncbi:MAG: hypothetical protein M1378_12230 [Bacteroidetes bacterium]|nr:hypothetical protein [Bacteroidota bacterium]
MKISHDQKKNELESEEPVITVRVPLSQPLSGKKGDNNGTNDKYWQLDGSSSRAMINRYYFK